MPKQFTRAPTLELDELHSYHKDITDSLRLYFNPSNPTFAARFVGKRPDEVKQDLASRLEESDVRSAFFVLTRLEASFTIDFAIRCKGRRRDPLSKCFREVERRRDRVRLDEDILEGWKRHRPEWSREIGELRGAFKFRHWLAHGRYWTPKPGGRYDFAYLHLMAEIIISGFGLAG